MHITPSLVTTVAPRHVSRHWRNSCQLSVGRRWQLASCWCLLQITFQPGAGFMGTKRSKSLDPILVIGLVTVWALWLGGHGPPSIQFWCNAQWCPSLWTFCEAPGWQVICNVCWGEASCNLAAGTWVRFLLCWDTALVPQWDRYWNVSDDCVEIWCVRIEAGMKFSTSECDLIFF